MPGPFNPIIAENRTITAVHSNSRCLADALCWLHQAGILTAENSRITAAHSNPGHLTDALCLLHQAGILTQDNFTIIVAHAKPRDLASALSSLHNSGILTPENHSITAAHARLDILVVALFSLHHAGILTEENFTAIATHASPYSVANALSSLNKAGLLTLENRAIIIAHANPNRLDRALSSLHQVGILTPENRTIIAVHANPAGLASALSSLHDAGILTQGNFNALTLAAHAGLLIMDNHGQSVLSRIPPHQLTQANYDRLVRASTQANPEHALQRTVNDIIHHNPAINDPNDEINSRQSTHTASVHQSVSASAAKLIQQYRDKLQLDFTIITLKDYILSLDDSPKHSAAKDCIHNLTEGSYSFFKDQASNVSTKELLGLFWLAIHDENKRTGSLDDGKVLLIDALYEIQRGYNLDEQGRDNGERAIPICTSGAFNKLMEKLTGVHLDVSVLFITKKLASLKLPVVVKYNLNIYLKTQSKEYVEALQNNLEISNELWAAIKDSIKMAMTDHRAAFTTEQEFDQFIDAGQYITIEPNDVQLTSQADLLTNKGIFHSSSSSSSSSLINSSQLSDKSGRLPKNAYELT